MRIGSIRDVAAAERGRRTDLKLSQAELARRAGVSRKWISEFEAGKPTAEFGLVIRVLDELGIALELISDEDADPSRVAKRVDLDDLLNLRIDPLGVEIRATWRLARAPRTAGVQGRRP